MAVIGAPVAGAVRAIRAERIRTGGVRGLHTATLGLAVGLPMLVTLLVAAVAEHVAAVAEQIQVTSVQTTNAAYWVLSLAPVVFACGAAMGTAQAPSGRAALIERRYRPGPIAAAVARWIRYGVPAALGTAALTAFVLVVLPTVFPIVYGQVGLWTAAGMRLVLVGGGVAFLWCGIGVAVGSVIPNGVGAVALILGWIEVIEPGTAMVPALLWLQRYLPFVNGLYGSGQDLIFAPPWSPDGAVLYLAAVTVAALAVATLPAAVLTARAGTRRTSRERRTA